MELLNMMKLNKKAELLKSEAGADAKFPLRGVRGLAVSIQGYEGSFHQVAAQLFFGKNVAVIPCNTFKEVIKIAGNKKEINGGVMAIENSIAGSILPNYYLLQKSNLKINRCFVSIVNRLCHIFSL